MLQAQLKETVASDKLKYNQVTVGLAAVHLSPSSYNFRYGILIKADSGNTDPIYLGGSTVSDTTGFLLNKGDSVILPITDSIDLYCISTAGAQKVAWIGV
jgi:hypothetical protein